MCSAACTVVEPAEVIAAFERLGWTVTRQRGSHIILTKERHLASLSVPKHDRVARGTLRNLISRAGISVEEFLQALSK